MLPRSYSTRSTGFWLFSPGFPGAGFTGSRLALATGALAIGLSAAYVREHAPDGDILRWGAMRALIAPQPRYNPPAAPFLGEESSSAAQSAFAPAANTAANAARPAVPAAPTAEALGHDPAGLREAIAFYKSGALPQGDDAAKAAVDPVVRTTLEWVALWSFPRETGFDRIRAFVAAHPRWPALDWLRNRSEEALFGDRKSTALIASYFATSQPQTAAGKLALARALKEAGDSAGAAALARGVLREADLSPALETRLASEFGDYLLKADYKYRSDRLFYKEQTASALRAATLAGPDILALAKARAAVIAEAPSDRLLAAVPLPLRADAGYKFALIQKLRRGDKISAAVGVMLSSPRDPALLVNGDEWWVERRLLARKLLDQGDAKTAYKLCAEHSAATREMQIEAEFHAGWIALRFLNDPVRAAGHFETLGKLAQTPMSRARAAYWRARAAEASGGADANAAARAFYQEAAAYPSTYYGQLARDKLGWSATLSARPAAEATGDARDESVKVVELLYAIGEKGLATPLALEAVRHLDDPAQVAALARVVARQQDAHVSLSIGKLANQRGVPLDELAFPTYGVPDYEPLQNSADPSIVYSIARQESAFEANAVSTAGAKGLMQMIASTARRTAERAGVAFSESRLLADAAFNAQLGAAHLGDLIAEQRGSLILTFAAYNAGGKRVKQWLDAYGDPRKPGVDPIDWVERIPFSETRNYVQRVVENLGVYRLRFASATVPVRNANANP